MKSMRWLPLSLIVVALMTQFNNCGNYADPATYSSSSSVDCAGDDDCILPTVSNLNIKVNYGGGTQYSVTADNAEFNLGGDCNEGGFPYNTVRWELYLNNQMVRHSGLINADSRCVNGRFLVYVKLSADPADNVNRTGLLTPLGSRAPYDLWLEVYGLDRPNGLPQRNNLKGRFRMSLVPI